MKRKKLRLLIEAISRLPAKQGPPGPPGPQGNSGIAHVVVVDQTGALIEHLTREEFAEIYGDFLKSRGQRHRA